MTTATFIKEIRSHLPSHAENVLAAPAHAKDLYGEKTYVTGEKLIHHVETVGRLLLPLHPDAETLAATMLQFVRDPNELLEIEKTYGKDVRQIIASLAILERNCCKGDRTPASLHRMVLVLSKDIRVLLVCLHNRKHALEAADTLEKKERTALAKEVLEVFAPLCAKLGIYSLKYSLETLAFTTLYPHEAEDIRESFLDLQKKHCKLLTNSRQLIDRLLRKEGVHASIMTREKHPFSIFSKMKRKGISSMTELYDLFGMRILVASVEDCYRVLGILHRTYRPILNRIKDYIAMPKPNGYQSLHSTMFGLSVKNPSMPVEVQIRTYEMDEEAEYGIAAHWDYKEQGGSQPLMNKAWQQRMESLQIFSENTSLNAEVQDELHEELLDRIFVLTPQGDPIELPRGATPLDFAFRIHTSIGLRFKCGKVNHAIAPIDQLLENGDIVEIQTHAEPRPSEHWIRIVRTRDARQKLRSYLQKQKQNAGTIAEPKEEVTEKPVRRRSKGVPVIEKTPKVDVKLLTDTPLPTRFAKCCKPEQQEGTLPSIVGFITRQGVVNVHKKECRMLQDANEERCIEAKWVPKGEKTYKKPSTARKPVRRIEEKLATK